MRSEATDQEARSENKYDTRSLETSYLARGQAMQVEATAEEILLLRSFDCPDREDDPAASLGRLVAHKVLGMTTWYFLLPAAGGEELDFEGMTISVVTPATPVGRSLLGKRRGDLLSVRPGAPEGLICQVE